jgi:hypothetical protein
MGKFFGENAVQQVAQPVDQAEIDRLQQQYNVLGDAAPTANMQWNRQAPQEVARTVRREQGVASLPGVRFAETPMMDAYNPAYTDYMNNLNQYNYDKAQFDRSLALENARLASDWSGQRADLMNQMNSLKARQGIGSLPGPFGMLFGIVRNAPNAQVTTDPRAQTQQELAYQNLQDQYSTNPLVRQQYTPPINAGFTPLATTMPTQYQF